MKRYKLLPRTVIGEAPDQMIGGKMIKDPEGEWIKLEDAIIEISKAHQRGYFTGHSRPEITTEKQKCNCAKHMLADYGDMTASYSWICPAHGYKRR